MARVKQKFVMTELFAILMSPCIWGVSIFFCGNMSAEPDLISNPGFEIKDNSGLPASWICKDQDGVFQIDETISHSGSSSFKLYGHGEYFSAHQEIMDVETNTPYKIRGYIRCDAAKTSAYIRIIEHLSSGKTKEHITKNIPSDNEWISSELEFTTMPNTQRLTVMLYLHGKGEVYFDDIELNKISNPKQQQRPIPPEALAPSGKNLISGDSSFEICINPLVASSQKGKINIKVCDNQAWDGTHSLMLSPLPRSGDWAKGMPFKTIKGQYYTLSLYAKANQTPAIAKLGAISTDWKHSAQGNGIPLQSGSWTRLSCTWLAQEDEYWLALFFDKEILIDAVQLEIGRAATAYKCGATITTGTLIPFNGKALYISGDKTTGVVSAKFETSPQIKNEFKWEIVISDTYGNIYKQYTQTLANDTSETFQWKFELPEAPGLYIVRSQIHDNNEIIAESNESFAVVPPPVEIDDKMLPFCGIDSNSAGQKELDNDFEVMKKMGIHWVQYVIYWQDIEPEKGKAVFPDLSCYKKHGFKLKVTLDGVPKWASRNDRVESEIKNRTINGYQFPYHRFPTRMEDYREHISAIAQKYADIVDIWEIGGEADITWGMSPFYSALYPQYIRSGYVLGPVTDNFAEMVLTASNEILKVNPNALIGAIRPGDCLNYTFSREIFKAAGKSFNLLPLDSYAANRKIGPAVADPDTPEFLNDNFEAGRKLVKELGNKQKLFISEIGWNLDTYAAPDSTFAIKQAELLAKTFIIARGNKDVIACMWFDWSNLGDRYNYALWKTYQPLPSVPAYSAVARVVENVIASESVNLGSKIMAFLFRKKTETWLALWTIRDESIKMIVPSAGIEVYNLMGNSIKPVVSEQSIILDITTTPMYLKIQGDESFKQMQKAIAQIQLRIKPFDFLVNPVSMNQIDILFINSLGKEYTLDVEMATSTGNRINKQVNVSKSGAATSFISPALLNASKNINITIKSAFPEFEKIQYTYPLHLYNCKKFSIPPQIDGDLSEWDISHKYEVLNSKSDVNPPDTGIAWNGPADLSSEIFLGWDDKNFYIAAAIHDDKHFNVNSRGPKIFNGDALQIAIDPAGLAAISTKSGINGYLENVYEFGLALIGQDSACYQWMGEKNIPQSSNYCISRDDAKQITFYEMAIPLSQTGLKAGGIFGFNYVIFDDDTGGVYGKYFKSAPGITGKKSASRFKKIILFE